MDYNKIICPHCSEELMVPNDTKNILCMYCGKPVFSAVQPERRDINALIAHAESLLDDSVIRPQDYNGMNQKKYEILFHSYLEALSPTLEAFGNAYSIAPNPEELLSGFGKTIADKIMSPYLSIQNKHKRELSMIDSRFMTAAFTIPAILEYAADFSEPLADRILEVWNGAYPGTPMSKGTYASIASGYQKRLCFISTAICRELGKTDDYPELCEIRAFRDGYLASQPAGQDFIREYYLYAPMIVRALDSVPDHRSVYLNLWEKELLPCVELLKEQRYEECILRCRQWMKDMERQWLR